MNFHPAIGDMDSSNIRYDKDKTGEGLSCWLGFLLGDTYISMLLASGPF